MTRRASPLVVGVALLSWSCGVPLMTLPAGPDAPADATEALAAATRSCRGLSSLSAEIRVRGSIAGERVRGQLLTGVAAPDALRIEAVAPFGQPVFIVVARGGDATVVLSDGRVVEHGAPGAVLEALTGVPIDAADLLPLLTGCPVAPAAARARAIGDWLVVPDKTADVFLRRDAGGGTWRLVAALHRPESGAGWRVEYRDFAGAGPHTIRLASLEPRRFDLRLTLAQVTLDDALGPEVFEVRMPAGATPISIDALRDSVWGR
jgi:hypothetical protein